MNERGIRKAEVRLVLSRGRSIRQQADMSDRIPHLPPFSSIECSELRTLEKKGLMDDWTVYIVECSDGTYYTGITNDLEKRINTHNSGKGAKYTSRRLPVKCVYCQSGYSQGEARREEIILKNWSKDKKRKLIEGI